MAKIKRAAELEERIINMRMGAILSGIHGCPYAYGYLDEKYMPKDRRCAGKDCAECTRGFIRRMRKQVADEERHRREGPRIKGMAADVPAPSK